MTRRQPKLPLALRIIAAGCVVLWLAGVSACNLEALFCCPSHGNETAAHEDHEHSQDGCATNTSTTDQMRPMKGGEHLLMLQGINTQAEAEAVKPDDSFAMVCGKCKTVYVTRVKS